MNRHIKFLYIALLICISFVSCTEFERFLNTNNSIIDESNIENETEDANFDKTTSGSSTTAGNPGNDEPIVPPVPSLTKFIVTSVDSDNNAIAMATGGMNSDYGILVTNETKYAKYLKEQNTFFAKVRNKLWRELKSASQQIFPDSFANHKTICPAKTLYQTCLSINNDGTIDSTALSDFDNEDSLSVAYYDLKTGLAGDRKYDSVLTSLVYLAQDSNNKNSLVIDGDANILQISESKKQKQTKMVKMKFDNQAFRNASGDFDSEYEMTSLNDDSSEIYYNIGQERFVFGDQLELSSYVPISCGEDDDLSNCEILPEGIDSSITCGTGCSYVDAKNKGDRVYFSTKNETAMYNAGIEELYGLDWRHIQFMDMTNRLKNLDMSIHPMIKHKETKAFDVYFDEENKVYYDVLVFIEDGNGDTRIIGLWHENRDYLSPNVTSITNDLVNIIDVVIVIPQKFSRICAELGDGMAVLLDGSENGSVRFLDYDLINTSDGEGTILDESCTNTEFDGLRLDFDSTNIINVNNPISWAFNDDKSLAFVLNKDSIFIIDVNNRKLIHTISLFVNLSGKEIDIAPQAIIYNHSHLIVGTSGIGSVLVFDVSGYEN